MPLDPSFFRDAAARYERFKDFFDALDEIGVQGTTVKLVTREGMSVIVSRVMMAALGKAIKTLQAIRALGVSGFGEDAALLLRANINLLINLNYITGDPEPEGKALDFEAYSYSEVTKWVTAAVEDSGLQYPHREPPFPSPELERRARRWRDVSIRERAQRTHRVHYEVAYRFYSSFEHCDFFGLGAYIGEENEKVVQINSRPSDWLIELVLGHTFAVTSEILECIWRHFQADTSLAIERMRAAYAKAFKIPPEAR
jgi:hypothetical protein